MPIHLDSHSTEVDLTPGTTKSDIVSFLYDNPGLGYSPSEVSDRLDVPRGTATTTLSRLEEDGYIGKTADSYYHALEDSDDVRRYVSSLEQLDRMFSADGRTEGGSPSSDSLPGEPARSATDSRAEAERSELEDEIGGEDE